MNDWWKPIGGPGTEMSIDYMEILNNCRTEDYTRETMFDWGAFEQGKRDCKEGVTHKVGKHEDYDLGYSEQYAHEQKLDNVTKRYQGFCSDTARCKRSQWT